MFVREVSAHTQGIGGDGLGSEAGVGEDTSDGSFSAICSRTRRGQVVILVKMEAGLGYVFLPDLLTRRVS